MEKYINEFIDYLKNIKHYSEKTCSSYFFDLKKFNDYLINSNLNFLEVSKDDIFNYMNHLKLNHYKETSINRKIVSLRSFYKYYINEVDESFINPMNSYNSLKTPLRLPKDLFKEQVKALLVPIEKKEIYQSRNQCIILLLLNTGMRVSELVNLDLTDIDLIDNCIRVFGKGKKERMVFFMKSCNPYLIKYINEDRIKFKPVDDEKALFLGSKGSRITSRAIEDILNARAFKANPPFKVTPHMLRHTFATNLLNNDVDLKMVQELLGHSSLAATQIYTHVSKARLKKVYENTHPMAKALNKYNEEN